MVLLFRFIFFIVKFASVVFVLLCHLSAYLIRCPCFGQHLVSSHGLFILSPSDVVGCIWNLIVSVPEKIPVLFYN